MSGAQLTALRDEVRAFLADAAAEGLFSPSCNSWMDGYDRAFTLALGARGWIGMTWPTDYGGGGRSELERYVVIEELLAAGAPIAAHWFADRQIGPQLLKVGTESQRARFLPAIVRGTCCFSVGLSEPDAGSDLAAVRTRATRSEGGWSVSGRKVWTSHAHHNEFMLTLVRSSPLQDDRHAGLSQMIIPLDAPGVEITPIRGIDGSAHFAEVLLDDVRVPDDMVLGDVGQGWSQVVSELALERSGPERFLSVMPLVELLVARLSGLDDLPGDVPGTLGRIYARLSALRELSMGVVEELEAGGSPAVQAALVKDLGATTELEAIEHLRAVRSSVNLGPDAQLDAMLVGAQLASPGFGLRGGTGEILRGIVGRQLATGATA